jgi:hypothetical protein
MRDKIIFLEYILLISGVVALAGCTGKKNTNGLANADSVVQNTPHSDKILTGTFEYSEPIENSYLYLRMTMEQNGDSLKGNLWSGIYLAKSNAGGFTNPTVLVECSLKGIKKDPIEMQLTITQATRLEEDAPDLVGMMNFPDLDSDVTATIWVFHYENGGWVSQNGLLMPDGKSPVKFIWEKVK